MKGELTLKVLEFLEEGMATIVDLGLALAGGGSITQVQRKFEKYHFGRFSRPEKSKETVQKCNNLAKLLYKLKKEGLIVQSDNKNLRLTRQGRKKLEILRSRFHQFFPKRIYERESDDKLKIVIFDIPEIQRWKRNWLRSVLTNLEFSLIQKSVWVGKNKIPEDFLEDLEKIELLPFVEIFEISKSGSLKSIVK